MGLWGQQGGGQGGHVWALGGAVTQHKEGLGCWEVGVEAGWKERREKAEPFFQIQHIYLKKKKQPISIPLFFKNYD